jgi:hypothetical protein
MPTPAVLFDAALTASFQASAPVTVSEDIAIFDFTITIAVGTVRVQWYLEYTSDNPYSPTAIWYRETAEEDIGNGDVRMPSAIRRFSTFGADADLGVGTYYFDVQLKRVHDFCRIRIAGNGAYAKVVAPVNSKPSPA